MKKVLGKRKRRKEKKGVEAKLEKTVKDKKGKRAEERGENKRQLYRRYK